MLLGNLTNLNFSNTTGRLDEAQSGSLDVSHMILWFLICFFFFKKKETIQYCTCSDWCYLNGVFICHKQFCSS